MLPRRRNAVSSVASAASPRPFWHRRASRRRIYRSNNLLHYVGRYWCADWIARYPLFIRETDSCFSPVFSSFRNIFESNKFGLSQQQMLRWLGKLATVHQAYAKVRPQLAPELFTTDGFTPHAPCISFDAPAHPPAHFHCNTALHHAWSWNRCTSRTGRSYGSIH